MCRKLKSTHPNFASLKANYRFDIVDLTGKVKDRFGAVDAQLHNVLFSKYSNYMESGAPIGDNSVQLYPPSWTTASLTYTHTNGDRLSVNGLGKGAPEGVHIYMVGQKPTNSTAPSTQYVKMGSYYYGVFTANGTAGMKPVYNVIYSFAGNPDASTTPAYNRLVKRDNNDDAEGWENSGAILNSLARTLSTRTSRESYCGEYIIGQRPSLNKNLPGPGYALRFNGSTKAEMLFNRPDEEYTVSFWYKNTDDKYFDIVSFDGPGGAGPDYTRLTGTGNQFGITAAKGWTNNVGVGWGNSVVESSGGWNYVTAVKKNDYVTLYINGRFIDSKAMGITSEGTRRDINFTRLLLGYSEMHNGNYFTGLLDELQIWDVALDSTTIRKWMCRKVSSKHPLEAEHLILYYNFDEGSGSMLENTRGAGDMNLLSGITYEKSGAPIGDTSVYAYYPTSSNPGASLTIRHPNGDYLKVTTGATGYDNLNGIQLYRVDGAAQFSTYPAQAVSRDTTRYWGVFICPKHSYGSMDRYTISSIYKYGGNITVAEEANVRMLDRASNATVAWNYNATPTPDIANDIFSAAITNTTPNGAPFYPNYYKVDKEFMLCGTTATAISVDTARPAQPGVISGPNPICSGASGLIYSVPKVNGYQYLWTLPAGMTGFSDSSKIIVTVDATASGSLGNIKVSAVNRNGVGPYRTLAVTAQSVPSLSVDIAGAVEVCSGQTTSYSIPPVAGATLYTWTIPTDATITANTQTSITVKFGTQSGQVSVTGTFTCGTSVINTKPVAVNVTPDPGITVNSGRACKGSGTTGDLVIKNSQIGVQYQAYKNGGTSPVGLPVTGTGTDLILSLPLADLLAGDNVLTIKAKSGSCSEVSLTSTPAFTVDVAPDPAMTFNYSSSVCVGDTAKIVFPNALSGWSVQAKVTSYWRVDDPSPKYIYPGMELGDDKTLYIAPSIFNGQLSSGGGTAGINKGRNDIYFTVISGSCTPVTLSLPAVITVPNNPHTINFNDGGLQWWINTGSPWNPMPNVADSIRVTTNRTNSLMCQTDSMQFTIYNAQANVSYYARLYYNTNGAKSYPGAIISNTVTPTADKTTVTIKVPAFSMPITPGGNYNDFDEVQVIAEGNGCKPVLASWRHQVVAGPDTTRKVIGSTICVGDNGRITIKNSQSGLTYRTYGTDLINPITSVPGVGRDTFMTIPAANVPALGSYNFTVTVGSSNCMYIAYPAKTTIMVINPAGFTKSNIDLAYDVDTTCKGLDDSVIVFNSLAGVNYQAYVNAVAVGSPVMGTGKNIRILLPYSSLAAFENLAGGVTISVTASAGSCITNVAMNNTKKLYVNGTVDLTNERTWINKNIDWRGNGTFMICPEATYNVSFPVQVRNVTVSSGSYLPVLFKAAFSNSGLSVDTLQSVTATQATAGTYSTNGLAFNATLMPRKSVKYLKVYVKEKGCPLHETKSVSGNNDSWAGNPGPHKVLIYPTYTDNPPVLPDTQCIGEVATVRVYTNQPNYGLQESEGLFSSDFQMLNASSAVVASQSGYWGAMNRNRYLNLPISAPAMLAAGLNTFKIQESYGGCPWHDLTVTGNVFINTPPDQSLDVSFINNCVPANPAQAIVKNAQSKVSYQPVMGGSGVASPKTGTGADLTFDISKTYIGPGTNEVSFQATIKGCPAVMLSKTASIQDVATLPGKPAVPSGPTTVCPGDSNLIYTVALDPNASSYQWTLPSGSVTTSASNSAEVMFGSASGDITVSAVNTCGTGPASDPLPVTFYPASQGGKVVGPTTGCPGESFDLILSGSIGQVVRWQVAKYPGIWSDIFSTDTSLATGPVTDTAYYRAEIQSGNCGSEYSAVLSITIPEGTVDSDFVSKPIAINGSGNILCLQEDNAYTTKDLNKTYEWVMAKNLGKFNSSTSDTSVSVNWDKPGFDTLIIRVTDQALNCTRMAQLFITIDSARILFTKCLQQARIEGNPEGFTVADTSLDAGVLTINCNYLGLTNDVNASASLLGSEIKAMNGDSLIITWTAKSKGIDNTCVSVIHIEKPTVLITPLGAFTPNSDGANDYWVIRNIDDYPGAVVKVFNRWGNLVFESKNYSGNEWKGTDLRGAALPFDSYHYVIDLKNGKKPMIGIVTIVR